MVSCFMHVMSRLTYIQLSKKDELLNVAKYSVAALFWILHWFVNNQRTLNWNPKRRKKMDVCHHQEIILYYKKNLSHSCPEGRFDKLINIPFLFSQILLNSRAVFISEDNRPHDIRTVSLGFKVIDGARAVTSISLGSQ